MIKYLRFIIKSIFFIALCAFGSAYGQTECPSNQILRFSDGSVGCMSEFKFFTVKRGEPNRAQSVIDSISGKEQFKVTFTKNLKKCPEVFSTMDWATNRNVQMNARALNKCEEQVEKRAKELGKSLNGCECEIIYDSSARENIPYPKTVFESKTRVWLATTSYVQDQLTANEKQANNIFLSEYHKGRDYVVENLPADKIRTEKSTAVAVIPNKPVVAVTAGPPSKLNPPLDNAAFQKAMKGNSDFNSVIQGYLKEQKSSLPALKGFAEKGDPFAQFFLGLAYLDDWTGMTDSAESCRWIKEAATAGVSSARYLLAQRAFSRSNCFSVTPTLDQAKIWAELASQSNDQSIKKDSQSLMQDILKLQIAGAK